MFQTSRNVSLRQYRAVKAESPSKAIQTTAALELQLKDLKERFEPLNQVLEQLNSIVYFLTLQIPQKGNTFDPLGILYNMLPLRLMNALNALKM